MTTRVASYHKFKALDKKELSEADKEILKLSKLIAKSWMDDDIGQKIKQELLRTPDILQDYWKMLTS